MELSPKTTFMFTNVLVGSTNIEKPIDDIICLFSQLLPYLIQNKKSNEMSVTYFTSYNRR